MTFYEFSDMVAQKMVQGDKVEGEHTTNRIVCKRLQSNSFIGSEYKNGLNYCNIYVKRYINNVCR